MVTGCTVDDENARPEDTGRSTTAPSPPTAAPPTASPTLSAPEERRPFTIAFAGDIHFEGSLRARLDDPADALAPVEPLLSAADLTVVNLETSIGTSGTPEQGKRYTFQAPPAALPALASAGVDIATMANNHGLDYGTEGLADTLTAAQDSRTRDPRLDVIGIGADADEAFDPAMRKIRGHTVAVLGASVPDDPTADPTGHWAATPSTGGVAVALQPGNLVDAVREARQESDAVIVYMHWGVQGESCPSASQTELAETLTQAGADVVVGSHAHRLQAAGMRGGTFVAYGLGNFVWYTQDPATSATGVLTLTIDESGPVDASWTPARIGADGLPGVVTGADSEQMTDDFAELRTCADVTPLR